MEKAQDVRSMCQWSRCRQESDLVLYGAGCCDPHHRRVIAESEEKGSTAEVWARHASGVAAKVIQASAKAIGQRCEDLGDDTGPGCEHKRVPGVASCIYCGERAEEVA